MHKNKNIPIALALTGVLTAGTAGYINNIKSDLPEPWKCHIRPFLIFPSFSVLAYSS